MLEMNPEIRAQWCAALRSGHYMQGRGCLRDGNDFCCLGVLTDLAAQAGVIKWNDNMAAAPELPDSVRAWAGLGSRDPELFGEYGGEPAASRNDSGETFAEIADLIDGGEGA